MEETASVVSGVGGRNGQTGWRPQASSGDSKNLKLKKMSNFVSCDLSGCFTGYVPPVPAIKWPSVFVGLNL